MDDNRKNLVDQVLCRCCETLKTKTFSHEDKSGRIIWKDHKGERWYGTKCPDCYKKYKEEYDSKRRLKLGHRPRGSVDTCSCGQRYIIRVGVKRMCPQCSALSLSKVRRKKS